MRLRSIISHVRITQSLPFLLRHYQYAPLPSPTCVRLLEIIPSKDATTIRCSLKAFELQDAPSFKALSYTWGNSATTIKQSSILTKDEKMRSVYRDRKEVDEAEADSPSRTRRHSIVCDGRLIKVTSNLRDALRMLANAINMPQMPRTPSYYWIDALCMNQNDIEERNSQVSRMADVFKKANGVVVWLGKEDEFTNDALATMQRISAMPENEWPLVPYTSFYAPEESQLGYRTNLTFHNWLGFMVLINRPWFKRAWVCQTSLVTLQS